MTQIDPKEDEKRREKLTTFFHELRKSVRKSQMDVSIETGLSQNYVARLEKGKIDSPKMGDLKEIAKAVNVDPYYILSAYIEFKYCIPSHKLMSMRGDFLNIDEIAKWEIEAVTSALWVVSNRFLDESVDVLKNAVKAIIERGAEVVFFLPLGEIRHFQEYKKNSHGDSSRLIGVTLTESEEVMLFSNCAIANPRDINSSGYIIVNDSSEAENKIVGIRMSVDEIKSRYSLLSKKIAV